MRLTQLAPLAALLISPLALSSANAQSFPSNPIKIVIGSAPGGGVDTVTRVLAQQLTERFNLPVVPENRSGGSGGIAADVVHRAKPDGYTLLTVPGSAISINDLLMKNLPSSPKDLESVSILTTMPLALVVRNDFPSRDLKELISHIRANPSKHTIANNGIGAASHLTAELFMQVTDTKLTQVPYKGTNPVLNDLLPGHVDMTFIPYGLFYELHQAKRVRILAVAAKERLSLLPDVPTMAELGYPQIISDTWNILSAPPGTPSNVMITLNKAVSEVLADPKIEAQFAKFHMSVVGGSLADAQQYVTADRERWSAVIKSAGIKPH